MATIVALGELRCFITRSEELGVMATGTYMMLELCAEQWDTIISATWGLVWTWIYLSLAA